MRTLLLFILLFSVSNSNLDKTDYKLIHSYLFDRVCNIVQNENDNYKVYTLSLTECDKVNVEFRLKYFRNRSELKKVFHSYFECENSLILIYNYDNYLNQLDNLGFEKVDSLTYEKVKLLLFDDSNPLASIIDDTEQFWNCYFKYSNGQFFEKYDTVPLSNGQYEPQIILDTGFVRKYKPKDSVQSERY